MSNLQTIRLVCFDLGGVLIRICRSWKEACLAAGLDVRGPWQHGDASTDVQRELGLRFGTGKIDCGEWAARLSATLDHIYSREEIIAIHDAFLIEEYEGVCDVVDRIVGKGLQTASLSNTNEKHWSMLTEYPVMAKLHHPKASHTLGFYKPDPAIYREFERQTGHAGGEIIFFDDLPENVEAARKIGWYVELIDPHSPTDRQIEATLKRYGVL